MARYPYIYGLIRIYFSCCRMQTVSATGDKVTAASVATIGCMPRIDLRTRSQTGKSA